jgi:hypothetical protein
MHNLNCLSTNVYRFRAPPDSAPLKDASFYLSAHKHAILAVQAWILILGAINPGTSQPQLNVIENYFYIITAYSLTNTRNMIIAN